MAPSLDRVWRNIAFGAMVSPTDSSGSHKSEDALTELRSESARLRIVICKLIMAKLGIFTISGESGVVYRFDVYPLSTVWTPIGAVYIVTHRDVKMDGAAEHVRMYLGELENLQELPPPPSQLIDGHRANCICMLQEKDEVRRRRIVADIAAANTFHL